jgi:alanine-glyoxylate transaminase/serine-glyoxylate transaminase/serine-pyruvate transaminase
VLVSGLETVGLEMLVEKPYRLPQLNAVRIPAGVDDAALRRFLIDNYQLEIGAGLGDLAGRIWRIGLMGEACRLENVSLCISALSEAMKYNKVA